MSCNTVPEYDKYIAPDGSVFDFISGDRFIQSFEGWGLPPIEYITSRGPDQHGETLIDFRLGARVIQIILRQNTCNRYAYWDARSNLINAIRPNKHLVNAFGTGIFRKLLPNGDIRDLNVIIQRGPIFQAQAINNGDAHGFSEPLRFIAHDPIIFDPTLQTETWPFGGSEEQLVFNTVGGAIDSLVFNKDGEGAGLLFESTVFDEDITIVYPGTWFSFPTIVITGPISGPRIENVTLGEFIKLNYTVSAGEVVTISLDYGNKVVENNLGVNLQGTVTEDSDLTTFRIAPDPIAVGGSNVMNVSGGGIDGNSAVVLTYYNRYIGI